MFDLSLRICVRLAAVAVLLGWMLSAVTQLKPLPYLVGFGVAAVAVLFLTVRSARLGHTQHSLRRLLRWVKQRRILPLIFLLIFGLNCIGAALHEPNNFDALCYRSPRVLYWLEHGGWHWIDTPYTFLSFSLPNFEWLTVPFFLLTGGFHAAVLINLVAFLFLPGLLFSLLRAFGVTPRFAYDWMWLFPTGYLVAMQAGGLGNDLIGMSAILAALYFAMHFAKSNRSENLLDSLLAVGFCTGIKFCNLPLALFVLIPLLRRPAQLFVHRGALLAGVVGGMLISGLIPMLLNLVHTGTVLGTTVGEEHLDQVTHPVAGWVGNGLIMFMAAISPPVFPQANAITGLIERGLGEATLGWLKLHYAKFTLKLNELPQEESGGLGLGLSLALLVCCWLWWRSRGTRPAPQGKPLLARWQIIAWWSWLAFAGLLITARLGTGNSFPRNVLPWLPLALAPVLGLMGGEQIARRRAWRIVAVLAALSVIPALFLTPSRPLIPVGPSLALAQRSGIKDAVLERARVVYEVY